MASDHGCALVAGRGDEGAKIMNKIIDLAMTTTYQIPYPFRASFAMNDVAKGLLLVSRDVHKAAHAALLKNNDFIFVHVAAIHPNMEDDDDCCMGCGPLSPRVFSSGRFTFGYVSSVDAAQANIVALMTTLKSFHTEIQITTLHIDIPLFTSEADNDVVRFITALSKVKVHKRLTLTGFDINLNRFTRLMPAALHMNIEPVMYELEMRERGQKHQPFHAEYLPARSRLEESQHIYSTKLNDQSSLCAQYITAMRDIDPERYAGQSLQTLGV